MARQRFGSKIFVFCYLQWERESCVHFTLLNQPYNTFSRQLLQAGLIPTLGVFDGDPL